MFISPRIAIAFMTFLSIYALLRLL